jgi:hypothetical protein
MFLFCFGAHDHDRGHGPGKASLNGKSSLVMILFNYSAFTSLLYLKPRAVDLPSKPFCKGIPRSMDILVLLVSEPFSLKLKAGRYLIPTR